MKNTINFKLIQTKAASLFATARTLLSSLTLLLTLSQNISAAAPDIHRASNIESLSNNSVMTMEQDDKGFLWLGTYDGLNRYDGKNIRVFRHEIGNRSSLTGNVITKLHKAQKGNLWVLTTMGLDKFSTDKLCAIEHYEAIKGVRHTLVCDTLGHA
ncbi:two-component regulator propeller domain-containing protein, partial [Muribaculum intestinale]|uniref:ligand-binding sensor domain-containing protein n=2 Tax=Bacteroidales TaxID=171549 RepID=UPI00242BA5C3